MLLWQRVASVEADAARTSSGAMGAGKGCALAALGSTEVRTLPMTEVRPARTDLRGPIEYWLTRVSMALSCLYISPWRLNMLNRARAPPADQLQILGSCPSPPLASASRELIWVLRAENSRRMAHYETAMNSLHLRARSLRCSCQEAACRQPAYLVHCHHCTAQ